MDVAEYRKRRTTRETPVPRPTCERCRKALSTCYCDVLRPFTAPFPFVILQHRAEARNPIATARMAHLSIRNSELIVDNEFRDNARVNALLAPSDRRNVVLYPGADSIPLSRLLAPEAVATDPRPITFWVLDAKWCHVPKMLRTSPNIASLPRAAIEAGGESLFSPVRMQPQPGHLSTLEAIFLVIEEVIHLRGPVAAQDREHEALLDVFRHLLRQQLEFVRVDARRPAAAAALKSLELGKT